jgi:hypothetical protein
MLHILTRPGSFGRSTQHEWRDGEPVPEGLASATVVDFRADGRELELIVAAMGGETGDPDELDHEPGQETAARRYSAGSEADAIAHQVVGYVLGSTLDTITDNWQELQSMAHAAWKLAQQRRA